MSNPGRLYTRKDAAKYLQEVRGIPCRPSRLAKDSMSKDGAAPLLPPAVARFGRTHLYTLDQIEGYAERLVRIEPPKEVVGPPSHEPQREGDGLPNVSQQMKRPPGSHPKRAEN
jgi:hypothetical protein